MRDSLLDILCCPACRADLRLAEIASASGTGALREIAEGTLACTGTLAHGFPIRRGIPRFVPESGYTSSFGLQWTTFRTTQFDSRNGTNIFRTRFANITGLAPEATCGQVVVDAGCGPGAFTDQVAPHAKLVLGIDRSEAVEAYHENFAERDNVAVIQADLFALPLKPGIADLVYCLGVLQHTPDPARAFASLPPLLAPAGRLAIWNYPKRWAYWLSPRFVHRSYCRWLSPARAYRWLRMYVPLALGLRRMLRAIPLVGRLLQKAVFVCDYEGTYDLSEAQLYEWALMDTFDSLATRYEIRYSSARYVRLAAHQGLALVEQRRDGTGPALLFARAHDAAGTPGTSEADS